MFGFMRKSAIHGPSEAICRVLETDGLPPGVDAASALSVAESRGTYSGRKVTYIRVFDPTRAAERAVDVRSYADLDAHPDLVLRMGHVEKDGAVVITWRAPATDAATPLRERADRTAHGDDEKIVFHDGDRQMALELLNLDERTRRLMLDELEVDIARGRLYVSPRLSEVGRGDYERLLRAAFQNGTAESLARGLGSGGRMMLTTQWQRARGGVTVAELPATVSDTLAENEFHRFYARGICRRAIEDGIQTLEIYRAGEAPNSRAKSMTMVGVRIDARSLLEDLQTPGGFEPHRGLPSCSDPGLSVRLP